MTVTQNDRYQNAFFEGNAFQRWCDAMGIPVKLNSKYWTDLRARCDVAADVIFQYQQYNFRKAILDKDPEGKCTTIFDGTYGTRGHHSQDCCVTALTDIPRVLTKRNLKCVISASVPDRP